MGEIMKCVLKNDNRGVHMRRTKLWPCNRKCDSEWSFFIKYLTMDIFKSRHETARVHMDSFLMFPTCLFGIETWFKTSSLHSSFSDQETGMCWYLALKREKSKLSEPSSFLSLIGISPFTGILGFYTELFTLRFHSTFQGSKRGFDKTEFPSGMHSSDRNETLYKIGSASI